MNNPQMGGVEPGGFQQEVTAPVGGGGGGVVQTGMGNMPGDPIRDARLEALYSSGLNQECGLILTLIPIITLIITLISTLIVRISTVIISMIRSYTGPSTAQESLNPLLRCSRRLEEPLRNSSLLQKRPKSRLSQKSGQLGL